jgi:hypothetical protein
MVHSFSCLLRLSLGLLLEQFRKGEQSVDMVKERFARILCAPLSTLHGANDV